MRLSRLVSGILAGVAVAATARAGGAWVAEPGQGDIQLGWSQKTAHTSWNVSGDLFTNRSGNQITYHDFRYLYLSGEAGIFRNASVRFLLTYLNGVEGPTSDEYVNRGLSDSWFGVRYQVHRGRVPMAVGVTYRTAALYDQPGAYNRFLFDSQGEIRGNNPEWRGLLKSDWTASYHVSRSFAEGGWASLDLGYTWREGAPADQIPVGLEVGYPLPWLGAAAKANGLYVRSRYNDSPREPDDRFGSNATFSFNEASLGRVGLGILVPLGRGSSWTAEVGYNAWVWGRSARSYREPYVSVGRRF